MDKFIQFLDTTPPRRTAAVVFIWSTMVGMTVVGTSLIVNFLIG